MTTHPERTTTFDADERGWFGGPADVKRFVGEGARAVLVGEALVKDGDPQAAVAAMTGVVA